MVYWEKLGEVAVDDLLTILVVEDDPFIQLLVEDALTMGVLNWPSPFQAKKR